MIHLLVNPNREDFSLQREAFLEGSICTLRNLDRTRNDTQSNRAKTKSNLLAECVHTTIEKAINRQSAIGTKLTSIKVQSSIEQIERPRTDNGVKPRPESKPERSRKCYSLTLIHFLSLSLSTSHSHSHSHSLSVCVLPVFLLLLLLLLLRMNHNHTFLLFPSHK